MSRRLRIAAGSLALLLSLAGCAAPAPASPAPDTVEPSPSAAASIAAVDARTLSGPATVAPLPEVTPVDGAADPALPVTTTGEDGTATTISDASRIVPLDIHGTFAQTLIGLGLGDRIVGRTSSDTEASLAEVPNVTEGGHTLNMEALLALRPSVVLTDTTIGSIETVSQLRASGVAVLVLSSKRDASLIAEQIRMMGAAFGVAEAAERLVERTETRLAEVTEQIEQLAAATSPKLRMAFLYVRGTAGVFFIFGKGSGADSLIGEVGAEDVASAAGIGETVPATSESLLALDPEAIVVMTSGLASTGGLEGLLSRPGVRETTAGSNQRVIDMADGDALSFGPQYPEALLALARAAYEAAE